MQNVCPISNDSCNLLHDHHSSIASAMISSSSLVMHGSHHDARGWGIHEWLLLTQFHDWQILTPSNVRLRQPKDGVRQETYVCPCRFHSLFSNFTVFHGQDLGKLKSTSPSSPVLNQREHEGAEPPALLPRRIFGVTTSDTMWYIHTVNASNHRKWLPWLPATLRFFATR